MGHVFLAMLSCGIPERQNNKLLGPCSIQRWGGTDEGEGRKLRCRWSSGVREGEEESYLVLFPELMELVAVYGKLDKV